MTLNCCKVKFS